MDGQTSAVTFSQLLAKDIDRKINGVIKANDEKELGEEVNEYVLTGEIQQNLQTFLEDYADPANHSQNGAWISGFFGSGKSHLLKMLSHILGEVPRALVDSRADGAQLTRERIVNTFIAKAEEQDNAMLAGALSSVLAIPATSILFNIDQKSDKDNATALLSAFIRVFDEARGYFGKNPWVAQFERDLDNNGQLDAFRKAFRQAAGKPWEEGRSESILWDAEIGEAYAEITRKPAQDSILERYENNYTATVGDFADDVRRWLDAQPDPRHRVVFLVDEVGQFIGQNTELMLQLQSVAEDLAVKTGGRAWVVVTSQEDMDVIIGDRTKQQGYDFSKIQARFAIKLKLNSADVIEVIQRRLLAKKPEYNGLMDELWQRQGANLRTLFEFSQGSATFNTIGGFGEEDFKATYPLVNYEFMLFQNALRQMSEYNMFDGRHSSVGERSMLAAISSTLRESRNSTVGDLVPFDRLYDGIADAIQSTANYRIHQAEKVLDPENSDLCVRLLKVLLLVKHVEGFTANPHNLRILLTDRFDADLMDLQQRIGEALRVLERETYVQRVGETYEYLTNEEQDVEQEIKNVDIDHTAVVSKFTVILREVLHVAIPGGQKVQYGPQKADFDFGLKIDQVPQNNPRPIWLNVVTSMDETDRAEAVRTTMGARDTITLLLGREDSTLFDDIRMVVKTDAYLRRSGSGNQSATRQAIIAGKRAAADTLYRELRTRVGNAVKAGTFVYNGETVEVKSTDPQLRVLKGMQVLISRYFTNFAMLGGVHYDESGLAAIIADAAADSRRLDGTDVTPDRLDGPSDEVLSFVTREREKRNVTSTVKMILGAFSAAPYGWPYAAILACIGHLYGADRIELTMDSKPVQRTQAVALLRNTHKQESLLVAVPRVWDSGKVARLREFAREFLGLAASELPSTPVDLAQRVADGLRDRADYLRQTQTQYASFAFVSQLEAPITAATYAAKKGTAWLLEQFTDENTEHGSEELLDAKDDVIDPILEFLHGSQRSVFADCEAWLKANQANMPLTSNETQTLFEQANKLMTDSAVYRGSAVARLKGIVDALKQAVDADVTRERNTATEQLDMVERAIHESEEWQNATEAARADAQQELGGVRNAVAATSIIANIRQMIDRAQRKTYPDLIDRLAASVPVPEPAPAPGNTPDTSAAPAPAPQPKSQLRSVHISSIARPHTKAILETTDDVDDFLDAYRRTLIATLNQGERILL